MNLMVRYFARIAECKYVSWALSPLHFGVNGANTRDHLVNLIVCPVAISQALKILRLAVLLVKVVSHLYEPRKHR